MTQQNPDKKPYFDDLQILVAPGRFTGDFWGKTLYTQEHICNYE